MANTGFQLKSMADINKGIFQSTDPQSKQKGDPIYNLPLDKLTPFKSHPFKLYTGQRFADMVESINANGVLVPIIVRAIDNFNYEILSGHNRLEAAKAAGLETVPAIIRDDLNDDEALLIVTETNLLQRSFADLSHSERAVTLTMHHEAVKKQGRRSDLIQEIENMVNTSNINDFETFTPVGKKLNNVVKLGQEYGMARNSVARYLRINKLIDAHKTRLDNGELAIRAAVSLSYLSDDQQRIVDDILDSSHYKIDMKKADALRQTAEKKELSHEDVEQILSGEKKAKAARPAGFKLKSRIVTKYFTPGQRQDEIESTIIQALDFYYAHKKLEGGLIHNGSNDDISENDAAGEALPSEIAD
jgi:ParB family chromosome partitioning protein